LRNQGFFYFLKVFPFQIESVPLLQIFLKKEQRHLKRLEKNTVEVHLINPLEQL
jgi:hypothetical protein